MHQMHIIIFLKPNLIIDNNLGFVRKSDAAICSISVMFLQQPHQQYSHTSCQYVNTNALLTYTARTQWRLCQKYGKK